MKVSLKRSFKINVFDEVCTECTVFLFVTVGSLSLCEFSIQPSFAQYFQGCSSLWKYKNDIRHHHSVHTCSVCSYGTFVKSFLTSTIRPLLMTQMRSAPCMVLRRWVIIRRVRPVVSRSNAFWTTRSDSASNALVASSRIKTLGFFGLHIQSLHVHLKVFEEKYMKINKFYFRIYIFELFRN